MPTFSATSPLIAILVFLLVLDIGTQLAQSTRDGDGACLGLAKPASCPINCFRADPVCGVDGVTYWCGCPDALCAGVQVAKSGFCEVGSGGTAPLPGQALLLVHIVWLFLLAFSLLLGIF
ncbi:hypothetical protein ACOSP7_000698 [Xanthoceras sorbifolium]